MTTKLANQIRATITAELFDYFSNKSEDCGMIASNSFNFPIVVDGEEGFVEIVVKVPKDDGDDNFGKRTEYTMKVEAAKEKAEAAAEKKAKKIERDKAQREAKAKAKAEREAKAE